MAGPKDIELIKQIAEGDEKSFNMLFERYFTSLTLYATKILNDQEAATDVVQNLFVQLYEERENLKIQNVKSFLFQATQNRCLNELKHKKIEHIYSEHTLNTSTEENNETEELIEAAETEARIAEAISQLPDQCRRIFEMSRIEGLKNDEIATMLNLSKRTVETQISKALKNLRETIEPMLKLMILLYFDYLNC